MAYVGRVLLKDPEYIEFSLQAFRDILNGHEIMAVGQRIGFTLRSGNNLLSEIERFIVESTPDSPTD